MNVKTEKPMATRWQDGLRMVKVCEEEGVKLFVIKQNRNNPTLKLLKRAINEKRFGKINMFNFNIFGTGHKNIMIKHPGEEPGSMMVVLL